MEASGLKETEKLPEEVWNHQPATSNKPKIQISTIFSLNGAKEFKRNKFDFYFLLFSSKTQ